MSNKDTLFDSPETALDKFEFNQAVSEVFDDMIQRSIPHYDTFQRIVSHFAKTLITPNSTIYDLGCSTGTSMKHLLSEAVHKNATIIGIDNSQSMLELAKEKLSSNPDTIKLINADLNLPLSLKKSSLVLLILTMQFVKSDRRSALLKEVYESLLPGGGLILVEKQQPDPPAFSQLFESTYYHFKETQGYSKIEISRKRDALEDVLVPNTSAENRALLSQSGFSQIHSFYQWLMFEGYVCLK